MVDGATSRETWREPLARLTAACRAQIGAADTVAHVLTLIGYRFRAFRADGDGPRRVPIH
jgi:hypothetical protein